MDDASGEDDRQEEGGRACAAADEDTDGFVSQQSDAAARCE
jgi:hypothetical protein